MLSYFTCDQVSSDPEPDQHYYNDANYCDPEYDKLYQQQKVELDRDKREQIVHEMLTRFNKSGTYHVLYTEPELQAYKEGPLRGAGAPAGEDRPGRLPADLADIRRAEAGERLGGRR